MFAIPLIVGLQNILRLKQYKITYNKKFLQQWYETNRVMANNWENSYTLIRQAAEPKIELISVYYYEPIRYLTQFLLKYFGKSKKKNLSFRMIVLFSAAINIFLVFILYIFNDW